MELPYELEELVLGYLIGNTSALRNCSLACRRFTPISQRILFARVEFSLSDEHIHRHPERFRDLILSSPHIANLVTGVSIIDRNHRIDIDRAIQFRGVTHLLECLPILINLQNLSLESKGFSMLPWTSLSSRMEGTLESIFWSVTNISLYRIVDIPPPVFAGCVALESLSLEFVSFMKGVPQKKSTNNIPDHARTRLKSLRLTLPDQSFQDVANWFMDPACPLDISGVLKLSATMTLEYYDHGHVAKLLDACAQSLQIFCFSPTFKGEPINREFKEHFVSHSSFSAGAHPTALNPIDLSYFPRLRILRLRIGLAIIPKHLQHPKFHLWVHDVVCQLRNSTSIQEISIKSSLLMELENGLAKFNMLPWIPVDEVLSTLSSLRRVTFFVASSELGLSPPILRKFGRGFANLGSCGILSVRAVDSKS